jgi:hypothetical protein
MWQLPAGGTAFAFADNEEIVGGPKVVIPSRKGRKAAAVTPWRCQRLGDVPFLHSSG